MVMSWIFTFMLALCCASALYTGSGAQLGAAVLQGAQAGITLAISLGGSMCLWTGLGKLMEAAGLTGFLSRLLRPALRRIFPAAEKDPTLEHALCANICANFLGLGNAATPMGILAAKRMAGFGTPGVANDQLCRLVVLNTASLQRIPSTVAALRIALGCATPFDILPAVWITSLCSAGVGLFAAWLMEQVASHD